MKSGKAKNIDDGIWQDREIRFDTKLDQLEMRSGELGIDSINSVEDTKGNNGEKGSLSITNLRLIWICHRNSRINLSIGYNAVVSINIRTANSRLRGNTAAARNFAPRNFELAIDPPQKVLTIADEPGLLPLQSVTVNDEV